MTEPQRCFVFATFAKDRGCLLSRQRSAARNAFRFFQLLVAVSRPINVLTELFIASQ